MIVIPSDLIPTGENQRILIPADESVSIDLSELVAMPRAALIVNYNVSLYDVIIDLSGQDESKNIRLQHNESILVQNPSTIQMLKMIGSASGSSVMVIFFKNA